MNLQTKPENFWTNSDEAIIIKTLTVIINGQKSYGKTVSLKDTYDYYKLKLNGKFTADSVLKALDMYTDSKNDIPAPSDLIGLMLPAPPVRITTAEFIHAKEQHALEGYPVCGYYGQIIKQYEKENADAREKPVAAIEDRKSLQGGRAWKQLT